MAHQKYMTNKLYKTFVNSDLLFAIACVAASYHYHLSISYFLSYNPKCRSLPLLQKRLNKTFFLRQRYKQNSLRVYYTAIQTRRFYKILRQVKLIYTSLVRRYVLLEIRKRTQQQNQPPHQRKYRRRRQAGK